MAYTATHKHARISARKVRSMANLIRGKHADEALDILKYMPHRGARMLEKVLKSASATPRIAVPLRSKTSSWSMLASTAARCLSESSRSRAVRPT